MRALDAIRRWFSWTALCTIAASLHPQFGVAQDQSLSCDCWLYAVPYINFSEMTELTEEEQTAMEMYRDYKYNQSTDVKNVKSGGSLGIGGISAGGSHADSRKHEATAQSEEERAFWQAFHKLRSFGSTYILSKADPRAQESVDECLRGCIEAKRIAAGVPYLWLEYDAHEQGAEGVTIALRWRGTANQNYVTIDNILVDGIELSAIDRNAASIVNSRLDGNDAHASITLRSIKPCDSGHMVEVDAYLPLPDNRRSRCDVDQRVGAACPSTAYSGVSEDFEEIKFNLAGFYIDSYGSEIGFSRDGDEIPSFQAQTWLEYIEPLTGEQYTLSAIGGTTDCRTRRIQDGGGTAENVEPTHVQPTFRIPRRIRHCTFVIDVRSSVNCDQETQIRYDFHRQPDGKFVCDKSLGRKVSEPETYCGREGYHFRVSSVLYIHQDN